MFYNSLATNSNMIEGVQSDLHQPTAVVSSTNMENDATEVAYSYTMPQQLAPPLLKSAEINFNQDIKRFLEKPIRIRTGVWNAATVGTFVAVNCPFEQLSNSLFKDKVDGFLAFRATLCARLQVNAQRFIQGRLIMHFIPQATVSGTHPNARNVNLMTITQQPNVQLDASCDTEVEMEIPYTSPTTHFNLLNGVGSHGGLYITVYSPIVTGPLGIASAEYTLWTYFKDVELVTPTAPGTFLTQSGLSTANSASFWPDVNDVSSCNFVVQSGRGNIKSSRRKSSKNKDPSEAENDGANKGPISSVLTTVSTAANTLAGIPLISGIAGPVSWATGVAAGIASYFGYSNPRNEEPVSRIVQSVNPYMSNCDGGDYSLTHALSIQNKVELMPGFAGTDLDESALSYPLSVPTYFKTLTWSTTDNPGDLKYRSKLFPRNSDYRVDLGAGAGYSNLYTHAPLSFIGKMFAYYRGSIGIRMKFVKTEFHSGRLAFAYSPGVDSFAGNLDQTNYVMREIIDIREASEYSFILPYAAVEEYKRVEDSYGQIDIYVVNTLVAPETVSQSISILMEVYAADDFEFAFPKPHEQYAASAEDFYPVVPLSLSGNFVSQSGGMGERQCVKLPLDNAIGSSSITKEGVAPAKFCIGERIVSFNQLVKRSTLFRGASKSSANLSSGNLRVKAHEIFGVVEDAVLGIRTPIYFGDQYSTVSMCYVYNRGSVRWRWSSTQDTNRRMVTTLSEGYQPEPVVALISDNNLGNASTIFADTINDGGSYVEIPQYNRLHAKLNRLFPPQDIYDTTVQLNYVSRPQTTPDSEEVLLFRAAGDDVQFGFFIGCPIVASA